MTGERGLAPSLLLRERKKTETQTGEERGGQ